MVRQHFGIKTGDILLMLFLLAAAVFLLLLPFFADEAACAEIVIAETGQVHKVPLDVDAVYPVTARGIELMVQVEDGGIFVCQSDCRDGICRNTPPISSAGQSIVCAPAGVVVRVTGEEAVVDGISG